MLTMSVSLEKSSSLASRFRDALPSIVTKSRHGEIWGIDLEHAEWEVVEVILEKVKQTYRHARGDLLLNLLIVPQKSFCNSYASTPQGNRFTRENPKRATLLPPEGSYS